MNIFNTNSLQGFASLSEFKSMELSVIIILINVILILSS